MSEPLTDADFAAILERAASTPPGLPCPHCGWQDFYLIPAQDAGALTWAQCEECGRCYGPSTPHGLAHRELMSRWRHCADYACHSLLFALRPAQTAGSIWAVCQSCDHVYGLVTSATPAPEGESHG